MGECGCASSELDVASLKIGDNYLVISIYPGCEECRDATVLVAKMTSQKNYHDFIDTSRIFDLSKLVPDGDDFHFPILEWSQIEKVINGQDDCEDISEYDSFADYFHDHAHQVADAVRQTFTAHYEEQRKRKKTANAAVKK